MLPSFSQASLALRLGFTNAPNQKIHFPNQQFLGLESYWGGGLALWNFFVTALSVELYSSRFCMLVSQIVIYDKSWTGNIAAMAISVKAINLFVQTICGWFTGYLYW